MLQVKDKKYTISDTKYDLESCWRDNRPYVTDYYELYDEIEETEVYLTVWSDGHYELTDEPSSIHPIQEGSDDEVKEVN